MKHLPAALTIFVTLLVAFPLLAQEPPVIDFGVRDTGLTYFKDCLTAEDLDINPRSTYPRTFILARNSLYCRKGTTSSPPFLECFRKLTDLPIGVLGFEENVRRDTETLRLSTVDEEYRLYLPAMTIDKISASGALTSFLAVPVVSVQVNSQLYSCMILSPVEVAHTVVDVDGESTLPALRDEVHPATNGEMQRQRREINGIDVDDLTWALRSVNMDPHRVPSLSDFGFDAEDIQAYRDRVDADRRILEALESGSDDNLVFQRSVPYYPANDRRDLFATLPDIIDTIGPEIVGMALFAHRGTCMSTGSGFSSVTLVNEAFDTLSFSFRTRGPRQPFNLPWTIHCRGKEFLTFNVELARMLTQFLPEEEERDERQEAVDLLYAVAWQLGEMRKSSEEGE